MTEEIKKEETGQAGDSVSIPSRSVLMSELQQLAAVSARNEMLTQQLAIGKVTPDEIKDDIENCVAEQSRIVQGFAELSDDEAALERFSALMSQIEKQIQKLAEIQDPEEVDAVQKEVMALVQKWSQYFEVIVQGVFEKAPEEK